MPSRHDKIDQDGVVPILNTILELELAGVVRTLSQLEGGESSVSPRAAR